MSWLWGKKKEEDLLAEVQDANRCTKEIVELNGVSNDGSTRHDDLIRPQDIRTSDESEDADDRVERKETMIMNVQEGTSRDELEDNGDHNDDSTDEANGEENEGKHGLHPPNSFDNGTTTEDDISTGEDDISMIDDDSSDVDSLDDDFLDSSSDEEGEPPSPVNRNDSDDDDDDDDESDSDNESIKNLPSEDHNIETTTQALPAPGPHNGHSAPAGAVARKQDSEQQQQQQQQQKNNTEEEPEDDDEEHVPTSFWEKQSLLMLAAEHDRVDILKSILTEDDDDKERLMNGGIPPLHLAVAFGSVNATQSLLRMGADPSVRPNVDEIIEQKRDQPKDSKVEIVNIRRFHEVSAWELAFGNKNYESMPKHGKSWSFFGSSSSSLHERAGENGVIDGISSARVIKPVEMAPSKREGVRHAFTAEALRCVGSDEAARLEQLVNSGMPATIDIGGKDLYSWAVEMGALQCEEFLRPSEAAKYGNESDSSATAPRDPTDEAPQGGGDGTVKANVPSFVIHRPAEETVPQLVNRLDELESLSAALSTCLDNLAEEVSVCHGLLILGGGASALASHVRNLKTLKVQKLDQLDQAQMENETLEEELAEAIRSSGEIGREIDNLPAFNFFNPAMPLFSSDDTLNQRENGAGENAIDSEASRKNLTAQIAASETKIRKLRASIADLSEENARDMKEVLRRGLEGGINLVRGLREELRDIDFQLDGARMMKMSFRGKIGMIHARTPTIHSSPSQVKNDEQRPIETEIEVGHEGDTKPNGFIEPNDDVSDVAKDNQMVIAEHTNARGELDIKGNSIDTVQSTTNSSKNNSRAPDVSRSEEDVLDEMLPMEHHAQPQSPVDQPEQIKAAGNSDQKNMTQSERIATGNSQAIAVRPPGNRGYFTIDLWQVLLRIIGYERESYRRGLQIASSQPHVMIV